MKDGGKKIGWGTEELANKKWMIYLRVGLFGFGVFSHGILNNRNLMENS